MTPSSTKERSTVVEKLLNRTPKHEPEVEDSMEAFKEARARSRETTMIDFRFRDGSVESFAYSYLTRLRYEPDDRIILWFGMQEIQVSGRNLWRIYQTITEHRAHFLQQGANDDDFQKGDEVSHIDEIKIIPMEEA